MIIKLFSKNVKLATIYLFLFLIGVVNSSCAANIPFAENIKSKEIFVSKDSLTPYSPFIYTYKKLSRFVLNASELTVYSVRTDSALNSGKSYVWAIDKFIERETPLAKLQYAPTNEEKEELTKKLDVNISQPVMNLRLIAVGNGYLYLYKQDLESKDKTLRFLDIYFIFNENKEIIFKTAIISGDRKE